MQGSPGNRPYSVSGRSSTMKPSALGISTSRKLSFDSTKSSSTMIVGIEDVGGDRIDLVGRERLRVAVGHRAVHVVPNGRQIGPVRADGLDRVLVGERALARRPSAGQLPTPSAKSPWQAAQFSRTAPHRSRRRPTLRAGRCRRASLRRPRRRSPRAAPRGRGRASQVWPSPRWPRAATDQCRVDACRHRGLGGARCRAPASRCGRQSCRQP